MGTRTKLLIALAGAAATLVAWVAAAQALDLPPGPQPEDLPGASAIPNISTVPGVPEVPGITLQGINLAAGQGPPRIGAFSAPFAEPGPNCPHEFAGAHARGKTRSDILCKPAAVNVAVLPDGRI